MDTVVVIFVPRDGELAQFVEDALAFKPVAIRQGRSVDETIAALRDGPVHALVIDIDATAPADARRLQAALADLAWRGPTIAVGTPTAEHEAALRLDHVLGARLTSVELRDALALDQLRAPKIAVPIRT